MHCTLWLHCSYDTSVLPGAALPLKVLIFGVPICRPEVRAATSCPISGPASAGPGNSCGGPEGTFPQLVNLKLGWFASLDPTFPLLERWPPSHLPRVLNYPMDESSHEQGDCWGVQLIHTARSLERDLVQAVKAHYHQGLQAMCGDHMVFLCRDVIVGEECVVLHPL